MPSARASSRRLHRTIEQPPPGTIAPTEATIPAIADSIAVVAAGLACGFLNTLASSGSAVSLPILVAIGPSPAAANATNRLPVLIGAAIALWTFQRQGQVDWCAAATLGPVAAAGSVVGVLLAVMLPEELMGLAITAAVLLALLLLFTKVKEALARDPVGVPRVTPGSIAPIFVVGAWLGFIVLDGATFLLLVLMLGCRFDLPHANALKALLIVLTTTVAIVMFAGISDVRWTPGLLMSAGNVAGGHLGARLSNHARARVWAFRLLVAVISIELVETAWHWVNPDWMPG